MSVARKPDQDAIMKRRKYLLAWLNAQGTVINTGFWTLVSLLGTLLCGIITIALVFQVVRLPFWYLAATVSAILTVLMAAGTRWYYNFLIESRRAAAALPYVPPVREQVASLPPEKVLLRGSEGAAAAQNQLLRAAHSSPTAASEELLHPTENRPVIE